MATDEIEITAPDNPGDLSATAARPQLDLHHLFALTGVAAFLLGIIGPQYGGMWGQAGPPPMLRAAILIWSVIYSFLGAIAITAVGYGIAGRLSGVRFFHQPGHWLLVDITFMAIVGVVQTLAFRVATSSSSFFGDGDIGEAILFVVPVMSIVASIARIALNIYVGAKKCDTRQWSWVFYLKAVAAIVQFFGDILVAVLLARAAAVNRRDRIPRDASHWLGVVLQLVICLLIISMTSFFMAAFSFGLFDR